MGLDMWVWEFDPKNCESYDDISCVSKEGCRGDELYYWRKHHDLHGFMENLYRRNGGVKTFNCERVRLTEEDLDELEETLLQNNLPETTGFFFGNNPPNHETNEADLEFISKARASISSGKLVYYDSWW